ncbi:MAG: hypothetical protein NXH85_06995 [Pseudomonadaceae bacterium]|nr:hypothetical protein [Pseudomonadaceae bacterium]
MSQPQADNPNYRKRAASGHLIACAILGLLLTGCTSAPSVPPPVVESGTQHSPKDAPAEPTDAELKPPAAANPATLALMDRSAVAARDGDVRGAMVLLERAIRIEPRNPAPWIDLGHLHLLSGALVRAEQSARKALALADESTASGLRAARASWLLIADIRDKQERPVEAASIRARWDRLTG